MAAGAAVGAASGLVIDGAFGFATLGAFSAIGAGIGGLTVANHVRKVRRAAFVNGKLVDQDARDYLAIHLGGGIYDKSDDKWNIEALCEGLLLHYLRFGLRSGGKDAIFSLYSYREVGFIPKSLMTRIESQHRALYRWNAPQKNFWPTFKKEWAEYRKTIFPASWFGDVTVFNYKEVKSKVDKVKETKETKDTKHASSSGQRGKFFMLVKDGYVFFWDFAEAHYIKHGKLDLPHPHFCIRLEGLPPNAIKTPKEKDKSRFAIQLIVPLGRLMGSPGTGNKVFYLADFGEGGILINAIRENCGEPHR